MREVTKACFGYLCMMLYSLGILFFKLIFQLASFRNEKARKRISALKQQLIASKGEMKRIWFHCASAGEYEQVIPILQEIRQRQQTEIVVSFFSSSGMDYYQLQPLADHAYYLPFDTPKDVTGFLDKLEPDAAIWVKYEFWFNILFALHLRKTPTILINADLKHLSEKGVISGRIIRQCLPFFDKVFAVSSSPELSELCSDCEQGFDTKWMKALENRQTPFDLPVLEKWKGSSKCCIAGSTHQKDIEALSKVSGIEIKWIIVPHEPQQHVIDFIKMAFHGKQVAVFSEGTFDTSEILIIDKIGMLKWLYRYADMAFVGGGFGKSVHNVLEAAAYEIPVCCGPSINGIPETELLIKAGLLQIVNDAEELTAFVQQNASKNNISLKTDSRDLFEKTVSQNSTVLITDYIQNKIIN
jgi:3-deoxy-D-manno-octulosonic-acid transferase